MGFFVLKIEISKLFNIYLKTHHMKLWSMGQISPSEKSDILNQHREIYNGYQTMQPKVSNTQPLYVQDFANDKGGIVVNNKGEVKQYTNFGINEQVESKEVCDECGAMEMSEGDGMCNECGGMMSEGECMECGWNGGDTMMEFDDLDEDIDKVTDISSTGKFDYTGPNNSNKINAYNPKQIKKEYEYKEYDMMESAWSEDLDEVDITGDQGLSSSTEDAYNFISGGPVKEYDDLEIEEMEDWDESVVDEGWEDLDEELYESFNSEKQRIYEMMNRMKIIK